MAEQTLVLISTIHRRLAQLWLTISTIHRRLAHNELRTFLGVSGEIEHKVLNNCCIHSNIFIIKGNFGFFLHYLLKNHSMKYTEF